MFFLPNESYKHRNKHFVITFGKPIPYQTFDKRYTPVQWAALVKDYTYSLVENPEGEFQRYNNTKLSTMKMKEIIPPVPLEALKEELTTDRFIRKTNKGRKQNLYCQC